MATIEMTEPFEKISVREKIRIWWSKFKRTFFPTVSISTIIIVGGT